MYTHALKKKESFIQLTFSVWMVVDVVVVVNGGSWKEGYRFFLTVERGC